MIIIIRDTYAYIHTDIQFDTFMDLLMDNVNG